MKHLTVISFVLGLLLMSTVSFAQEDPVALPPSEEQIACYENASKEVMNLFGNAVSEIKDRPLSDYSVVYLVSDTELADTDMLSAASVDKNTDELDVVTTWAEFVSVQNASSIDAVLIHASAFNIVDKDWLQNAYRQGLPVVTINMSYSQRADLLGDSCTFANASSDNPFSDGNFFVASYWILHPQSETDRDNLARMYLETCDAKAEDLYAHSLSSSRRLGPIADLDSLLGIARIAIDVDIIHRIDELQPQAEAINAVCTTAQ